jgi:hypothetical protein
VTDVSPIRQDATEILNLNVRFTERIWKWLDEVDRDQVREHLLRNDFISVRKLMDPYLFPLLADVVGQRRLKPVGN